MNLKAWRQKEGMTQAEAAKYLSSIIGRDLLPSVLSRWERRDRAPRKEEAAAIVAGTKGAVRLDNLSRLKPDGRRMPRKPAPKKRGAK